MRAIDIIIKKRDKQVLSAEEIEFFINGYSNENIPDYQAAAFAMAVLLNGMTHQETTDLTLAMARSGDILDLSGTVKFALDKHSTGGVGDKTSLVVAPIISSLGLPVGKMSGRGLGFSGGTLDKMESIPGFRTDLTTEEFLHNLQEYGIVLTGQTGRLAPADGKLYALRDVTGTVPSLPLIASSIMSKKIAAGAERMVLDVKQGKGAFMQDLESARELAEIMVQIARLAGRQAVGLLSDMNQPLGFAVGNALEVKEAIETLQGGGPKDFKEHCLEVSAQMLLLGEAAQTELEAHQMALHSLENGAAWQKFVQLVRIQGGDVSYIESPEKLPLATIIEPVLSIEDGYISEVNARIVGETSVEIGAGRAKKSDEIDLAVGIIVHKKVGDRIKRGEPLFTLHINKPELLESATSKLQSAVSYSPDPVTPLPLFYGIIR
ncbi:MAG: thymidine phosphorylase [Anaerolineales bacterium]|nr:thymidine phosphorylase [Anaerolineales bacterium]